MVVLLLHLNTIFPQQPSCQLKQRESVLQKITQWAPWWVKIWPQDRSPCINKTSFTLLQTSYKCIHKQIYFYSLEHLVFVQFKCFLSYMSENMGKYFTRHQLKHKTLLLLSLQFCWPFAPPSWHQNQLLSASCRRPENVFWAIVFYINARPVLFPRHAIKRGGVLKVAYKLTLHPILKQNKTKIPFCITFLGRVSLHSGSSCCWENKVSLTTTTTKVYIQGKKGMIQHTSSLISSNS